MDHVHDENSTSEVRIPDADVADELTAGEEVALTRRLVCAAVDEYGAAWTTQDPERIARLFTEARIKILAPTGFPRSNLLSAHRMPCMSRDASTPMAPFAAAMPSELTGRHRSVASRATSSSATWRRFVRLFRVGSGFVGQCTDPTLAR